MAPSQKARQEIQVLVDLGSIKIQSGGFVFLCESSVSEPILEARNTNASYIPSTGTNVVLGPPTLANPELG